MASTSVGVVYDDRMCAHEDPFSSYHPEQPARITSIWSALEQSGVLDRCVRVPAREATKEELKSVHTEEHIDTMCNVSKKTYGKKGRAVLAQRYNSIYFNEGSSSSALLAAGSVIELCLRVARGQLHTGAAIVRPPGHHAEADKAMGFCLFNNVAVAAQLLAHGKEFGDGLKVLIVDWDVHHGNGTQHMFWEDPNVLYFSVHRYDDGMFYPMGDDGNYDKVGEGPGAGFNINVPWPQGGFGDGDYLAVWDHVLMPIACEFNPDVVLISGGFDSARGDPLGGCNVTPYGYSVMTEKLMSLAGGKVVLALEGGYNLESIADSYLACLRTLLGDVKTEPFTAGQQEETWSVIDLVRLELSKYWPVVARKADRPATFAPSYEETVSDSSDGDRLPEENAKTKEEPITTMDEISKILHDMTIDSPHEAYETVIVRATPTSVERSVAGNCTLRSTYVWYATYGSNLWLRRLMCYIEGGKVDGARRTAKGLLDKTPPVDDMWLSVPHRLFFARDGSVNWGPGGVAFLDPISSSDSEGVNSSHLRAYKITLEQFNGILAGENLSAENMYMSLEKLESLKTSHYLEVMKDTWYGGVLYLGETDGLPILTITCSREDAARFRSGELPMHAPGDAYKATIVHGLLERGDFTQEAAEEYVALRI